jgi:hypothetical protein
MTTTKGGNKSTCRLLTTGITPTLSSFAPTNNEVFIKLSCRGVTLQQTTINLAMRVDFSTANLSLFSAGYGIHDVVRSQFLAEQLPFPSSLPIEARMAFARNMCDSRSGDPDDRFESMALEFESDNFEQYDLEKYSDINYGYELEDDEDEDEDDNKRGSKGAKRRKCNPRNPKEDSFTVLCYQAAIKNTTIRDNRIQDTIAATIRDNKRQWPRTQHKHEFEMVKRKHAA